MPRRAVAPPSPAPSARRAFLHALLGFALIFSFVWVLHVPLLRLPYFWDESGYFIPAAHDLLLTGNPVPASTLSNAHPPLVMAWLAFCWKLTAFSPLVTRTAMLLVTALALLGLFQLARYVSNRQVALATVLLTALYPVFFAQSSLAHLDMMAGALTLWGLNSYVRGHRGRAVAWFALLGLAKETALITPLALLSGELLCLIWARISPSWRFPERSGRRLSWGKSLALALCFLPLAGWLAYHYARTGVVLGNPEYYRYNVSSTLHPIRVVLALVERVWQMSGYLNMFLLTGVAALALLRTPLPLNAHVHSLAGGFLERRPGLSLAVRSVFAVVIAGYLSLLSVVGGAVLARYLAPVYPLVILCCVFTLWRRIPWWKWAVGLIALAFVAGLFLRPPYRIAPEDNLTYTDYVRLHQDAALILERTPHARVLSAWPATDELQRPYLGYVSQPMQVVPLENFTAAQLDHARRQLSGQFDAALVFSTKYEPPRGLGDWWEDIQTRYFDYHRDLPPEAAAALLGGKILYREQRGAEWVAVISAR